MARCQERHDDNHCLKLHHRREIALLHVGKVAQMQGSLDTAEPQPRGLPVYCPANETVFSGVRLVNRASIVLDPIPESSNACGRLGKAPDDSVPRTPRL